MTTKKVTLLHVSRWNDALNRVEFLDRDGTIQTDRDQAEVWSDETKALAAAEQFGGSVDDAFEGDDDDLWYDD